MFIQGIDTSIMTAINQKRLNAADQSRTMARIETGTKINVPAEDPSGLGISVGMTAQMRGTATAIHNLEEGINFIRTAEGVLREVLEILHRQRDVAVEGANEAVQYTRTSTDPNYVVPSSTRRLFEEHQQLDMEIYKMWTRDRFNTKLILFGYNEGQPLQGGPDNAESNRIDIVIPDTVTLLGTSVPVVLPGDLTHAQFVDTFQRAIDKADNDIALVADVVSQLGEQEIRIMHAIDDLNTEYINVAASKSRILDTDMALEITELTRLQITDQSSTVALQQTTVEKSLVSVMIDAVGLSATRGEMVDRMA